MSGTNIIKENFFIATSPGRKLPFDVKYKAFLVSFQSSEGVKMKKDTHQAFKYLLDEIPVQKQIKLKI